MTESRKRKVCVVLVDRANYGRLKPVMTAIKETPQLELLVLAAGIYLPPTLVVWFQRAAEFLG